MLDQPALDLLFNDARTYNDFSDKPVSEALLQQVYELAVMGPTSANCLPMRIVFVQSAAAKEKLKPCLMEGNRDKTMSAPICAIIAMDMEFYEKLPTLFPHTDAKSWFTGKPDYIKSTAFRNSSLQGAYFLLAARALGLDCGPMSGFDEAKVNDAFLAGTTYKANFLVNLGYGTEKNLYPRAPRLSFNDACKIV
ncbi:MAG: malonic semialdehyde reductase [Alphaproteobacteria bacterium]|nr:malonic semialdehyde reductase [Alphaproteobacteria bacterium]